MRHFAVIVLLCAGALHAKKAKFSFKFEKNDVIIIDKYQDIRVSEAGQTKSREEKNRIVLTVNETGANGALMNGVFNTYSRTPKLVGQFRRDRDFVSKFVFQADGQNIVSDDYVMPNLRSLPAFPEQELAPGDKWKLPALETMDFDSGKIKIPLEVSYHLIGETELPEESQIKRKADEVDYKYAFRKVVSDPRSPFHTIVGVSADRLWFDREQGMPLFDINRLTYTFYLRDGNILRMAYRIDSWWKKTKRATDDERKQIVSDTNKDIATNPNVSVRETAEGIVLDLNSILFDTDSARLTPQAQKDLEVIAQILKKYPDREIRVSGHTDSTGRPAYNQTLSEQRAKSVVLDLTGPKAMDSKRFSYRGYGEARPVAPNTTPEGRAKNRRVEILIVTE
ncbi:MAG: OmpA family protein [Spirochaetia bacterium]|nr:OmpA family protein [Spirochaetia bacterium]